MSSLPSRLRQDPLLGLEVLRKLRGRITSRFHRASPGLYESLTMSPEDALATLLEISPDEVLAAMNAPSMQRVSDEFGRLSGAGPGADTAAHVEACYAVVRLLHPTVVLETGVRRGFSSAGILQALEDNEHGRLCSVDLPTLSRDESSHTGTAVPVRLRDTGRWQLTLGPDAREVPRLLKQLGQVDVVFYDSDKSYQGMMRTWRTAWAALRPGGVLMIDDINSNDAYATFVRSLGQKPLVFSKKRGDVRWFIGLVRKPDDQP
jgi:predicted O-methyltransferase YrrM